MKVKYTAVYSTTLTRSWVKYSKAIAAHNDSDARLKAKEYTKEIEKLRVIGRGKNTHRLREDEKPILVKIIKSEEISLT